MVGLLMAGLAVAKRFGTVPGVILCALAAGVKSPALLGVLFLGWVWAGREASTRRRIGHTAVAGLIALATMEVVSLISGTGWGWIRTTTTADTSFTGVTPINIVARVGLHRQPRVAGPDLHLGGPSGLHACSGCSSRRTSGTGCCSAHPQDGVVRCLGLTLLVLALLGPIVWAWYVTWGVIVLAPAAIGRLRTALIVISTFWAFAGLTAVHGIYMRPHAHLRADRPAPGGHAARRGHHAPGPVLQRAASAPAPADAQACLPAQRRRRRHDLNLCSALRRCGCAVSRPHTDHPGVPPLAVYASVQALIIGPKAAGLYASSS